LHQSCLWVRYLLEKKCNKIKTLLPSVSIFNIRTYNQMKGLKKMESMIIYGFLTIFSIGLCIISFLSYVKSHNKKLLFVSTVFLLFILKGVLLSISLFMSIPAEFISIQFLSFVDVIVLLLLFMATLKK